MDFDRYNKNFFRINDIEKIETLYFLSRRFLSFNGENMVTKLGL